MRRFFFFTRLSNEKFAQVRDISCRESIGKGAALEEFVASYHHHMIADTYQQKDEWDEI